LNSKRIILPFLFFIACIFTGLQSLAQQKKPSVANKKADSIAAVRRYKDSKVYKDSIAKQRRQKLETLQANRKHYYDSLSAARRNILDSAIKIRKIATEKLQQKLKRKTDSLAAIRKYKESRRYQDSLRKSRNARIDSMRNFRTRYFDSLKLIRQKGFDSAFQSRKKITDSLRSKQKNKSDSLSKIRKYKESKRYRDSVQVTRQSRLDSIRIVRKIYSDNIIYKRKKTLDSLTKIRTQKLDSLSKIRKIKADSLQNARDLRADSLAKKKELREQQIKAEQKKKEDKMKLQFELKMKKKHEAWSNEKMLKKKWGFVRRSFQNMFTRYNYYFNARRKMMEANGNMTRRKKDNFEQLIDLFPFDPNKDSTVFASDMDTIIRKASVGLQIHDPRTKWADDLYLLMGEAYYFKGDYARAESCFKYIVGMNKALKLKKNLAKESNNGQLVKKEQSKLAKFFMHQPAHNDAILWLTRTFADSKRESDAEAILDLIDASSTLSSSMKAKIALERANLDTRRAEYADASKQLGLVLHSKSISKYTRQRASFLNGQLFAQISKHDSAANSFSYNISLHPPIEMDFYARKYKAESIAQGGGNQSKSIASLKYLLKDGKYAPYHEQVYYILGKLSANENNYTEAIKYYQKSIEQSKTTPKQKAISFASMGNLQYKKGMYNLAKKSFDSASYFAKNIKDNPELDLAIKRGKSLDKIEEPYYVLRHNDSLLRLSLMNEKEQKNVIKKYLKYLEKLKEDSIFNAQNAANAGSLANNTNLGNTTSSWYFGSTVAVQQGYNEFKRKWGNRTLIDNWRRASASNFGNDASESISDSSEIEKNSGDGLTEESLLAAIPKTEQQRNNLNKKIKRAYLNLSTAYIKDLEEFNEGLANLDSLDKKYPNHEFQDEELSIKYTAALRQGHLEDAEQIRQDLISKYPNSTFAIALKVDNTLDKAALSENSVESVGTYYQQTYELIDERKYTEVIKRVNIAKRIYGDLSYSRKFRILEAQSFASLGNYRKADTLVNDFIREYPSDSLRPWVDAISQSINEQKAADTLNKDSSKNSINTKQLGTIDSSGPNAAIDTNNKKSPIPNTYQYAAKEGHYCIFIFGKPEASIAGFRSGLRDFSTVKFSGISINSDMEMLNPDQAMVITKTFGNAGQAKIFMNAARNEKLLFREIPAGSYQSFIISEQNFLRLKADKKLDNYLLFYQKNYKQ
jgi:tetratricopeptide (TPR) repeat protein